MDRGSLLLLFYILGPLIWDFNVPSLAISPNCLYCTVIYEKQGFKFNCTSRLSLGCFIFYLSSCFPYLCFWRDKNIWPWLKRLKMWALNKIQRPQLKGNVRLEQQFKQRQKINQISFAPSHRSKLPHGQIGDSVKCHFDRKSRSQKCPFQPTDRHVDRYLVGKPVHNFDTFRCNSSVAWKITALDD